MHDAKSKPLKAGDVVLIPCVIKETYATEDFCNVYAESLLGRRPDDAKETFNAINTAVMLRANDLADLLDIILTTETK
jgi:hypothetical protein